MHMPIRGYLIEQYNDMADAYTCRRLAEEAAQMGIDLKMIGVHDTWIGPDGLQNAGRNLEKRDFVINRYKWGSLKDEINGLADKSYNALPQYHTYLNKYTQVKYLKSEAFLTPGFLLGTSLLRYETAAECLGQTYVAKGLESSMGREVFLIKNQQDQEKLRQTYGIQKEWLFEEFISASEGKDVRIYSIRGDVTACIQRTSLGDFRANVALGATVEPFGITPPIQMAARDIYRQTGLDFVGIDLLFGEAKFYFCEINIMPGIEGAEKATGVNVAKKMIEMIQRDFDL